MTTYSQYFPAQLPTWLADDVGTFWGQSFGMLADGMVDGATNATKCGIVATAPDDALPYLGADRPHVLRVPGESAASYRAALGRSFEFAALLGTDEGIIETLARAGLTATVIRNNQWDWDGHPGNVAPYWARMWVVIEQPNPYAPGSEWGAGDSWGGSFLWGVHGLTPEMEAFILAACFTYKSSHARLVRVRIILPGTAWGGGFTWGGTFAWTDSFADIYIGADA